MEIVTQELIYRAKEDSLAAMPFYVSKVQLTSLDLFQRNSGETECVALDHWLDHVGGWM
jgi:hypothetical protein